jgi:hypothetical protein
VTILFADLVDFTKLSSQLSVGDLVRLLNGLFSQFDRLALDLGVEKIKTRGDAYMVAGGLPEPRADRAHAVADMALAMIEMVERINCNLPIPLQIRIGIHSDDMVAGVIGTSLFCCDAQHSSRPTMCYGVFLGARDVRHETAGVHHDVRRRYSRLAVRRARTAGGQTSNHWVPGRRLAFGLGGSCSL